MKNEMRQIIDKINEANHAYYNLNQPIMTDHDYDILYDKLLDMESATEIIYADSPTQNVGYVVKSALKKVKHNHPMLSLDKTKSIQDIAKFIGDELCLAMLKMDGLTINLHYENGELVSAETRGNGIVGEDVLHNVKTISNIPLSISYKDTLDIDGECIIDIDTFDKINEQLSEENKYKNPRNLASGSVRQLDSKIAAERKMKFIAWKCVTETGHEYFDEQLNFLQHLGFTIVPFVCPVISNNVETMIEYLKKKAEENKCPIDGIVFSYADIEYGKSLGATSKFPKNQIAFKFYDEEAITTLKYITWGIGRTGVLTPVAVFEPVELEGTTIERASVHNISILKQLNLTKGDEITVYKANMIIPQIADNLTKKGKANIPQTCPYCGGQTIIVKDNETEVLKCNNSNCNGKLIEKFSYFCSREAMNIDGLSRQTILSFRENKIPLNKLSDIYKLSKYRFKLIRIEGFGVRSIDKILNAIEMSKKKDMASLIVACGIPGIGKSQAKILVKRFKTWNEFNNALLNSFDFTSINGFGEETNKSIYAWYNTEFLTEGINEIVDIMEWNNVESNVSFSNILEGKTFCITGKLHHFKNRDELINNIEVNGGSVLNSVSKNTTYLINNDKESTSGKNKKAILLGIKIINEDDYLKLLE